QDMNLEASSSILDVLKSWTMDTLAQQHAERQFREIGEKVGESLLPIFEIEGAKLNEETCTSIALAVAETLNTASSAILVQNNLEPSVLAKYLLAHPVATEGFNQA